MFKKKELQKAETLGEKLKKVREENKISLAKVADAIKVPLQYLLYLEKGEYKKLPNPFFIKQYLRKYADYLQISWMQVKKMFDQEISLWQPPPAVRPKSYLLKRSLIIPKFVFGLIIFFLIFAFALYFTFEIVGIFQPPSLEVNLAEFVETKNNFIRIEGKTEPEGEVFINGQEIMIDESGKFSELIPLQEGLNTLKIGARKKFSKEEEIIRQVLKN